MSDEMHSGGCACGKFRFEARGEPYRVGLCHCLTCRKAHGAPFNFFLVFPTESVRVNGDVLLFRSSDHAERHACRACGSQAHSHYGRPDEIYLYPGSFDEPGLWQPSYELWIKRRESWLPEFPSVVQHYEGNRPKWRRSEP
jgi:hypothetical protein